MTEGARDLFRLSVQAGAHDARNARGVFRPRAFGHAPVHLSILSNRFDLEASVLGCVGTHLARRARAGGRAHTSLTDSISDCGRPQNYVRDVSASSSESALSPLNTAILQGHEDRQVMPYSIRTPACAVSPPAGRRLRTIPQVR